MFLTVGNELEGCTYEHPLISGSQFSLLHANHVTDKGTGLVHTAPAHGQDDFLVALRNSLPVVGYFLKHGKIDAQTFKGSTYNCEQVVHEYYPA